MKDFVAIPLTQPYFSKCPISLKRFVIKSANKPVLSSMKRHATIS